MNYCIIGGDERYVYLSELLSGKCKTAMLSCPSQNSTENIDLLIATSDVVILPIPLTRDGLRLNVAHFPEREVNLKAILNQAKNKKVFAGAVSLDILKDYPNITDFAKSEGFAYKNAVLTAEGCLSKMIELADKSIMNSNTLILGFGRIAKIMAKYLKQLGSDVTIIARNEKSLAQAHCSFFKTLVLTISTIDLAKYDYIINTIPHLVLKEDSLKTANKSALIIDLASAPGGIDFTAADKLNLSTAHLLNLPGIYCPKTAAELILEEINYTLEKE